MAQNHHDRRRRFVSHTQSHLLISDEMYSQVTGLVNDMLEENNNFQQYACIDTSLQKCHMRPEYICLNFSFCTKTNMVNYRKYPLEIRLYLRDGKGAHVTYERARKVTLRFSKRGGIDSLKKILFDEITARARGYNTEIIFFNFICTKYPDLHIVYDPALDRLGVDYHITKGERFIDVDVKSTLGATRFHVDKGIIIFSLGQDDHNWKSVFDRLVKRLD